MGSYICSCTHLAVLDMLRIDIFASRSFLGSHPPIPAIRISLAEPLSTSGCVIYKSKSLFSDQPQNRRLGLTVEGRKYQARLNEIVAQNRRLGLTVEGR